MVPSRGRPLDADGGEIAVSFTASQILWHQYAKVFVQFKPTQQAADSASRAANMCTAFDRTKRDARLPSGAIRRIANSGRESCIAENSWLLQALSWSP